MTLPDWIDPLVWSEYLEMRKKIRKPMTAYAERVAINKLFRIWQETGDHPNDVLDHAILCCWVGVWPIPRNFTKQRDDELNRELRVGQGPVVPRRTH